MLREAAEEHVANHANRDSIFEQLRLQLMSELNDGDDFADFCMNEDAMWDGIPSAVARKSEKVATARWFQYIVAVSGYMRTHVRRLILSLYVSISLGLFKHGKASDMVRVSLPKTVEDEDIAKGNTSNDKPEVQAMRRSCSNTFSFTTSMLADPQVWKLNMIIAAILKPCNNGTANRMNRSPAESLQRWTSMAEREALQHINLTTQKMQDAELFRALRIQMGDSLNPRSADDIDDMDVESQNELCEVMTFLG